MFLFVSFILYTFVFYIKFALLKNIIGHRRDLFMKERIKKIMDSENMTPGRFADYLEIGRAVISHILNGRNNPSLDVISRILLRMPQINSDWLITGSGSMYKTEVSNSNQIIQPDLFADISLNNSRVHVASEFAKENIVKKPKDIQEAIVNERVIYKERTTKKVNKIIIYYSDNTFETFESNK